MRMLGFTLIATTALWGTAAQGQADAVSASNRDSFYRTLAAEFDRAAR